MNDTAQVATAPDRPVLIGLSPRLQHRAPGELGPSGKVLQYLEQSVAHSLMAVGAMVVMVPTVGQRSVIRRRDVSPRDYAHALDALVLQGGADIDPRLYGEDPTPHLGDIDPVRDRFELDLLQAFVDAGKPVLGICRGMQLLNVGRGGTLYQDVTADGVTAMAHRDLPQYELYTHEIVLEAGSRMAGWFPDQPRGRVNSIHHQSLKRLGDGLVVEARATDGVIEAVRLDGADFVYGVQWHPEFHPHGASELLSPTPLLEAFVEAADRRRALGLGTGVHA